MKKLCPGAFECCNFIQPGFIVVFVHFQLCFPGVQLNTVDSQLIKMARSIGASKLQIIFKVMLVEALPTLVSNFTIMMINMLNTSAMAGAVGAGGLGAVALTYGYQRFDYLIMYFIVIILIFLVMLIQGIGNKLYKLTK